MGLKQNGHILNIHILIADNGIASLDDDFQYPSDGIGVCEKFVYGMCELQNTRKELSI